jgi:hypothetical protein
MHFLLKMGFTWVLKSILFLDGHKKQAAAATTSSSRTIHDILDRRSNAFMIFLPLMR